MSEFKKWWYDWTDSDKLPENTEIVCAFEAGQKSQQAKIDELQGRIDGALKILDSMRHNGAYRTIDILKGN